MIPEKSDCMDKNIVIYFDYLCPYAWRGAEFVKMIEEPLGLSFDWRHYSLHQGNYKGDDGWKLWEDAVDADSKNGSKGLIPFLASHYVKENMPEQYDDFRLNLQRLAHKDSQGFRLSVVKAALKAADISGDIEFDTDAMRKRFKTAHEEAVSKNVVATPTFFLDDKNASYFRIGEMPTTETEAVELFQHYVDMLTKYPYLETLRRPKNS